MQRGQSDAIKPLVIILVLALLAFLVLSPNIDLFGKISGAFSSYQDIDTRIAACNGFAQEDLVSSSYCNVNTEKAVKLNEQGQFVSCLYLSSVQQANPAAYACADDVTTQATDTCRNLVTAKKITSQAALEKTIVNGKTCKELGVTLQA